MRVMTRIPVSPIRCTSRSPMRRTTRSRVQPVAARCAAVSLLVMRRELLTTAIGSTMNKTDVKVTSANSVTGWTSPMYWTAVER